MRKEIWLKISDRYEVSNLGQVRSVDKQSLDNRNRVRFKKGKLLKPAKNGFGYLVVNVSGFRHKRNWKVHQLVAIHFLPNPMGYPCINHKNGNKTDNRAENLEWCTHSHNAKHAFSSGLAKPPVNTGFRNGISKVVIDCSTGVFYGSIIEASRIVNLKPTTLGAMLRGQNENKTNLKFC